LDRVHSEKCRRTANINVPHNIYVLYIHIPILSLYRTQTKRYLATEGGNNMDAG